MAVVNETVAEVAEQVAEEALEVAEVSRSLSGRDLSIGLFFGGAIGAGATFLILRKKLETKYNQLAEEEINEMREHFRARLVAKENKPDLGTVVAEKIVEDEGYATPNSPTPPKPTLVATPEAEEEPTVREPVDEQEAAELKNVFESDKDADEGWDYEHETNMRTPDKPYVIHYDERSETNYSEATFVYYAGDDVLCDARDNVVEDKDKIVGEENLTKFGHGSNDKNVVYVRNDVLAADFEIVRHEGDYAEVVHGFVKHSDERRRRRPRFDDD